jgi:hypothetical protein
MAQSPAVEQVRIKNVAGTFVLIEWDDIGGPFTYEIQKSANGGSFIAVDFSNKPEYFDVHATPLTEYVYRVRAVSTEYSPSIWVYTDTFRTFENNSYAVIAQSSVSIYKNFINEKLVKANNFVNFNRDTIEGILIREGYNFSDAHTNITDLESYILFEDEALKIYGDTSSACGDRNMLMPVVFHDYLFMFERFQPVVRYSDNLAQSWISHPGVSGRTGNPVGSQVGASTDSALYVIGYDGIYALTFNTDVKWSSIDTHFGSIETTFSPGKAGSFRFSKLIDLPAGVGFGQVDAIAVSDDYKRLYIAALDTVFTLNLVTLNIDAEGNRNWNPETIRVTGDGDARVKNLVGFGSDIYAYVCGVGPDGMIAASDVVGVYKIDGGLTQSRRVYGDDADDRSLLDMEVSNLSRSTTYLTIDTRTRDYEVIDDDALIEPSTPGYEGDDLDPERVDYGVRYQVDPSRTVTKLRAHRQPLKSFDGDVWFAREENYHYESQYVWYSGNRIWINYRQKLCVIESRKDFQHAFKNASEVLDKGKYTFYADGFSISDFPGYTIGMAFYRKDTGALIGFYNLGYRTRDIATFSWIPDRTILTGVLASNEIDVVIEEPLPDNETDIVPPLEPMVYQFLPEHFIHNEPLYVEFVEEYLKFLSSDVQSDYGQLYNLLRNHDVNESAYLDMFVSDLAKRNVYLGDDKWEELVKFSSNRSSDIYSIKGIKESYRFLFKFLYNEDVIVSTEGDSKYEFDIVIDSDNLTADLVGNRIKTESLSGQADVVYYERYFDASGKAYWQVTLNNIMGEFVVGDELISEVDKNFRGTVYRGVTGKEKPLNNEDYLSRGPTYYAISVQSGLQVSKYKEDVIRFIHPVGFGFVGIMLITMFVNSGVSTQHKETIIDLLQTLKWDMGLPKTYPDEIPDLNADGSYKKDKYGRIQYKAHPQAGQPYPLRSGYLTENPALLNGQNADQRRKNSFLWDSSNMRFIETRKVVNGRLKDGISQRKDS